MAGREARTQDCSAAEARGRLAKARKFLEVGELVQETAEDGDEESASGSAALLCSQASPQPMRGGKLRAAGRQARAVVEFAGGAMRR
jgi:hypothetical protein